MADETGIIRIELNGRWTAVEFAKLFADMEDLNSLANFGLLKIDGQSSMPFGLRRASNIRFDHFWTDAEFEAEVRELAVRSEFRRVMRYATRTELPALVIKRIELASPGFGDLAGVGRIVAEVRKFLLGVTDRYIAREDRALAREDMRQTILKKKLANAEALLKLADKAGIDSETRNEALRRTLGVDHFFESKILEGKITGVKHVDAKGNTVED